MREISKLMIENPELRKNIYEFRDVILYLGYSLIYIYNSEVDRLFEKPDTIEQLRANGFFSEYNAAVLALSFVGRETNKNSIYRLLSAYGFVLNPATVEKIEVAEYHNPTVYVGLMLFLTMIKKEITVENILVGCAALDIQPDAKAAAKIVSLYKALISSGLIDSYASTEQKKAMP